MSVDSASATVAISSTRATGRLAGARPMVGSLL
jgi:hypothetical protein